MNRDNATLLDINQFAQEILELTQGMDEETFTQNRTIQLAVLYKL
jgi:uncharacterized protein with HEPN domain